MRSLRGDLERIPFPASLHWSEGFRDINDRSGRIRLIGTLVVDVHFLRIHRRDHLRIFTTNEHAAVRIVIDPELHL